MKIKKITDRTLLKKILGRTKTAIPDFIAHPISEFFWHQSIHRIDPKLTVAETYPDKLRLILGLGRSGTTWVGRVLAETSTPIRFIEEPLPKLRPKVNVFSHTADPSALGYVQTLSPNHPLIRSYKLLTVKECNWQELKISSSVKRNDQSWELCLVKEVHGLLATRALLKTLKVPCVIITRNPLYSCDSLFYRDGVKSPYLYLEKTKLHQRTLHSFLPTELVNYITKLQKMYAKPDRKSMIVRQLISQSLIQILLVKVARQNNNCKLIKYEDICTFPYKNFIKIFNFLEVEWNKKSEDFLSSTIQKESSKSSQYICTVTRDTKAQVHRPFKFLTLDEVNLCENILENINFFQLIEFIT